MLVLTRKLQQQIKIGDNITVTVLRVSGTTVRIGIDAPRDVRVLRNELPVEATSNDNDGDKQHMTVRAARPRNNSRFNMPARKTPVAMPTIAK